MTNIVLSLSVALLMCFSFGHSARTVENHLNGQDLQRFETVFKTSLSSNDLQSIYYATLNVESSMKADDKKQLCQKLNKLHDESKLNEFEKDFYLVGSNKVLKCTEKLPEALLSKIYAALKTPATSAQEIFYRFAAHKYLGVQIDEATVAKIVKNLQEILKKDDTLSNLGYAFSIATDLGSQASFIADRIEDAIVQADEVDGKLLQFEGGLSITALIINGAFKTAQTFGKPLPITAEQSVKFASYFLSRRSVQTSKGAHVLKEALKTLASSNKNAPICVQLIGNGQLKADAPHLTVAIVDLLGKPLSPAPQNVFAKIFLKKDNSVLVEKVSLVSKSSDKTTYEVDLSSYKPTRALYVAEISVDSSYTQNLNFKVLGKVKVQQLEIGVGELDASSAAKKQNVAYPSKLQEKLSADNTQKILLKTILVEESEVSKPITVHQCFVRFYNKENHDEIIYVAELDSTRAYKFDIDVGARAADFKHKSGLYEVSLIVGDSSISNSFQWLVADIEIKFPANAQVGEAKKHPIRSPLPEIKHQFRVPDKRPSRIVSDIFTGLCLTPLVLLLVFWSKLGINIGNFTFHPSTIGFHLGFGGILVLFTIFWLKLNMFQTLRLLIPIAIFTFLCGNRLLRRIYAQRIAKNPSSATTAGATNS